MFGFNHGGINAYAQVGVETGVAAATPHKLIVMLYDGAIAACQGGLRHMQDNDFAEKGALLSKAIAIIESGLRASLDRDAGGELAASLDALYGYMTERLYRASLRMEPALVEEVLALLLQLRSAWVQIAEPAASQVAAPQAPATAAAYLSLAKA